MRYIETVTYGKKTVTREFRAQYINDLMLLRQRVEASDNLRDFAAVDAAHAKPAKRKRK